MGTYHPPASIISTWVFFFSEKRSDSENCALKANSLTLLLFTVSYNIILINSFKWVEKLSVGYVGLLQKHTLTGKDYTLRAHFNVNI